MPSNNDTRQYQQQLGEFGTTGTASAEPVSFDTPPIPPNQGDIELVTPIETLDVLQDPGSDIREWLSYIEQQYTPPEHTDTLLLYPCAAEKPMPESNTYEALETTLAQFRDDQRRRVHVVTVSEPMGLIPFEFQDGETWLYDNPGLFPWYCKRNGLEWSDTAQQLCLQILGESIGGFLSRAVEEDWYANHIACVRHCTSKGRESDSHTHRQMLEAAEHISGADLTWLPEEDTVLALVDGIGKMAWNMSGVGHDMIQAELAEHLETVLNTPTND